MEGIKNALTKLDNLLASQGLTQERERLQHAANRKEAQGFSILVTGEYSRGKTTFLNALIGQEVLATSLLRLPTVNILKGGESSTVKLIRSGVTTEVSWDSIRDIQDAEQVELTWNHSFLLQGIEIMEYPSMSEAPNTGTFEKAVAGADLVLVVVAADSLYSNVEATVFDNIIRANGHQRPLFIVNFWDRIAEKDKEEVKQAAFIRLPVNEDRIFILSAEEALEGKEAARSVVAAIVAACQAEANRRAEVKEERLSKVVLRCIDGLKTALANDFDQASQQQEASELAQKRIKKAIAELKETRDDIQDGLSEIKNGTRDVVQAKINNFFKELNFRMRGWVENYKGDDLTGYLNTQLGPAIEQFNINDFEPYLRRRSEEQSELLENGATRFQNNLEDLYRLLQLTPPSIKILEDGTIALSSHKEISLSSDGAEATGARQKRFDFTQMLQVPESVIALAVAAVGSFLFKPFAVVIAPAGLFMSGLLAYFKSRPRSHQAADTALYERQIAEQAGRMEAEITKQIVTQMDALYDRVNELLSTLTKTAEHDARDYMQRTHLDGKSTKDGLNELDKICEELGV